MGASRPTGSISDVTTQKVLRPAAATAGQSARSGTAGMAAADAGAAVVAVVAECMSDRWKNSGGKRSLSAPDVLSQSTDSSALIKYLNCQTLGTIRGHKTLAGIDHIGDLRAFVRVADACNFTLAAERLGLTRSAVGKCVARLAGLGVRLLHRSTRSVSLSDEGRLFYEHATRILSEVDNAAGAMARRKQTPRGRLRIDVPVSMGRLHVLPLVREYLDRWPDVEAELSFSDDYSDLVRDGIDLAIRIGGDGDSRLVRRVLAPHRLITCASPAYLARHGMPATLDELPRHQVLAFVHAGVVPWRYSAGGEERQLHVAGRLRLGNTEALRDAALAGAGIAQLGAFLVGEDLRAPADAGVGPSRRPARRSAPSIRTGAICRPRYAT